MARDLLTMVTMLGATAMSMDVGTMSTELEEGFIELTISANSPRDTGEKVLKEGRAGGMEEGP